jgi:outer membrane protein, multidrug efflux system
VSLRRIITTSLVSATLLTGCMVGPDYKRPTVPLPATYPGLTTISEAPSVVSAQWWRLYDDPLLNDLVTTSITNNVDVRAATARIDEADSTLRQVNAAMFPEFDLGGHATRTRFNPALESAGSAAIHNDFLLTVSTSFELDVWGRLRRAAEAARAQALSTVYARDVITLTLAGATVQAYFSVRSFDAQIIATRETLRTREESLALVNRRARGGVASGLDVAQAEGLRAQSSAQLKELIRLRTLAQHLIGTLTGQLDIVIAEQGIGAIPLPPTPPPGLPSSLIERRPDVRAAEQQLVAANAEIGVARAALFPTISLTGDFGSESSVLHNLFTSGARVWGVGLNLAAPIFDFGRRVAAVEGQEAQDREVLANYEKTIQTGFREVADALTNLQLTAAAETDQQARVKAARDALRLANRRYEGGLSPYFDVLDAQRTVNEAELVQIQNRLNQLSASVDLMKALGGGWSPERLATAE